MIKPFLFASGLLPAARVRGPSPRLRTRDIATAASMALLLLLGAGPAGAVEYVAQVFENGVGSAQASETSVSATAQGRFGLAVAQSGRRGTLRAIARARNDLGLYAALSSVEEAFRIVGPGDGPISLVVDLTGNLAGIGDYSATAAFDVSQAGNHFEGEVRAGSGGAGSPGDFQLLRTLQLAPNSDFVFSARVFAEAAAGETVATMRRPRLYLAPEFADLYTLVSVVPGPGEPGGVPEPSTWAAMILGFGMAGAAVRRRRSSCTAPTLCG